MIKTRKIWLSFALGCIILSWMILNMGGVLGVVNYKLADYTINNSYGSLTYGDVWKFQSFKTSQNGILTTASLNLFRTGNPGQMNVSLYLVNSSNHITGSRLATGNLSGNSLTTSTDGQWYNITMDSSYNIIAGLSYGLLFQALDGNASDKISGMANTPGTYADGIAKASADGGATWGGVDGQDWLFEIWGLTDYSINSQTYNSTTYETYTEGYIMNMTYNNSAWTSISANLIYNGTSYSSTKYGSSDEVRFEKSLTMPIGSAGTKNVYWTFGLTNSTATYYYNTSTVNQVVKNMQFGICNSTLTTKYLNISFKDETTGLYMNGSIDLATFSYTLDSSVGWKGFTYSNTSTSVPEYLFCSEPTDKSIYVNYTIQYSYTGYTSRRVGSMLLLTNTTTNKTFYLLDSGSGSFVTFQVVNTAEQTLSGVFANATRNIFGTDVIVGSGYTGNDGGITFWVNYLFEHTFEFSYAGYSPLSVSLVPSQSTYTVYLGGTPSNVTSYDYQRGISYSTSPNNLTLFNQTTYNFIFNLSSSYWNVDEFGFILRNSTSTLGSNSSSANGGSVSLLHNTGNNTNVIYMDYYWVINSTYTNTTRVWVVLSSSGTDWSLSVLFTDLKTYISSGLWGLTSGFGIPLITFLFIFIFTGIMSYKFGLTSPAAIMALIFSLVLFFDIGIGFIPNVNNIHFVTIFTAIILAGILFREATQ